jgi:hypothetical protein
MSNSGAPRDDLPTSHFAELSLDGEPGTGCRHVRCCVAAGSTPRFTGAMTHLLRTRLRLAILIIPVGFALHFLRVLLLPESAFDHRMP